MHPGLIPGHAHLSRIFELAGLQGAVEIGRDLQAGQQRQEFFRRVQIAEVGEGGQDVVEQEPPEVGHLGLGLGGPELEQ